MIIEENKKISQFIELDEEQIQEIKKKERENLLSKYRVQENIVETQVDSDEDDSKVEEEEQINNNQTIHLSVNEIQQQVDVKKINYLKMLENLRDQEVSGKVDEQKLQDMDRKHSAKKQKKKEMFDMFDDEVEDSSGSDVQINDGIDDIRPLNVYETDDDKKYYRSTVGEILNKDYKVTGRCGKGVFSSVVRAINLKNDQEVAIKILRNEEIYLRSGEREKWILEQLNSTDLNDKKHILRLLDHFDHKKHLCLVFELMDMNLREAIRTYGRGSGLSLDTVRSYATQIFLGLSHLRKNKIIHADIKPDNIVLSKDQKTLRICDFGTAFPVEESSLVDYLVSRYYRAPEVIIGYQYDMQIDVWSTACTLYELYTGKFLFQGDNNNQLLREQLQTMGKFSLKILTRASFVSKYFDQNFTFLSKEFDPVTKSEYYKPLLLGEKATRDLASLLKIKDSSLSAEEQDYINKLFISYKKLVQFKDLLEKCLQLDPKNRMTPDEALLHPFINVQLQQQAKNKQ